MVGEKKVKIRIREGANALGSNQHHCKSKSAMSVIAPFLVANVKVSNLAPSWLSGIYGYIMFFFTRVVWGLKERLKDGLVFPSWLQFSPYPHPCSSQLQVTELTNSV